jgi:hypothetical protein
MTAAIYASPARLMRAAVILSMALALVGTCVDDC